MSPMIVCDSGMSVPMPMPWMARAAMSHQKFWREAGEDRAGHEDDEAAEVEAAAAVEVAHLADDRHGDGADEHRGGGEPRVVVDAAELGDDARHGRPDDRLADRGHEHAEHERDEDVARGAVEPGRLRRRRRRACWLVVVSAATPWVICGMARRYSNMQSTAKLQRLHDHVRTMGP